MCTLTIWASDTPPPGDAGPLVLWQGFLPSDAPEDWHSLPQEVDENRESLRSEYLAWLHGIGLSSEGGVPPVDRFVVRPNFSYWWMSIPATYSLEIDSPAFTAVRMMALVRIMSDMSLSEIRLVGINKPLARMLQDLAEMSGAKLTVACTLPVRANGPRDTFVSRLLSVRVWLKNAAPPISAMWVLAKHAQFAFRQGSPNIARLHKSNVTVIDYLAHFGPSVITGGAFSSNFWGDFVTVLDDLEEPVRWLHISARDAAKGVSSNEAELIRQFNRHRVGGAHELLQSRISMNMLARAFRDYMRVNWLGLRTRKRRAIFRLPSGGPSLWPAFRSSFRDQVFGGNAMRNCLWLNLFEAALRNQPKQRLGLYLFENQPWEMALIHAWRTAGHGELLGVSHSTMLFWDTRYFKDPSDMWALNTRNPMPWPDKVVVNGPLMRRICTEGEYPPARLVEAEALRFSPSREWSESRRTDSPLAILIIAEYSNLVSARILRLVEEAIGSGSARFRVAVRPHPANPDGAQRITTGFDLDVTEGIVAAIQSSDVVICGAFSSASLESLQCGRMTVIVRESNAFISNPADGIYGVSSVESARELASILERHRQASAPSVNGLDDVFFVDKHLTRWRRILSGP